ELVLDRILGGEDVELRGVDAAERSIQRGRLAATGGAGDQDDPVAALNDRAHPIEGLGAHADLREVEQGGVLVEQTHDDPLPVRGGDAAHADVDVAAGELDADAAVLREALLGDVQLRHDLHAADDAGLVALGRLDDLLENAVDAEAHHELAVHRLD